MGKLLVRLRRRLVHLFSQSISSTMELQFSRVFIQNPSHKSETHLSFAGTRPPRLSGSQWRAGLPANERFEFLCALSASVVNTSAYLGNLILSR